jgi:hypothetical protein
MTRLPLFSDPCRDSPQGFRHNGGEPAHSNWMEVPVAQHVKVVLVDDLDGSSASDTVSFGLDGRSYEIDLSEDNAGKLRDALAAYVAAARRAGGSGRRPSAPRAPRPVSNRDESAAIRLWARENGHDISERGRIPNSVTTAYAERNAVPEPVVEAPKKRARKLKVADAPKEKAAV